MPINDKPNSNDPGYLKRKEDRSGPKMNKPDDVAQEDDQEAINKKVADQIRQSAQELVEEFSAQVKSAKKAQDSHAERMEKFIALNRKVIKENSKYLSDAAEDFHLAAGEMEAFADSSDLSKVLNDKLSEMVKISDNAVSANFAQLKDLKTEAISTLRSLEIMKELDPEDDNLDEVLKMSKKQVKLLSKETDLLKTIEHGIASLAKTGLGALVGAAANSPILAIGIDAVQKYSAKSNERKGGFAQSQIETLREQRSNVFKQGDESQDDFTEDFIQKMGDKLDESILSIVGDDASDEAHWDAVEAIGVSVIDLLKLSKEEGNKLTAFLAGSEEERREMVERNRDLLEVLNKIADRSGKPAKEDDNRVSDMIKGGIFLWLANLLKTAVFGLFGTLFAFLAKLPKMIMPWLGRVLPKLFTRLFPIAGIIMGLFSGISDAIDEFKKTGSIGKAVIAGIAGVLDFLTLGLIGPETFKKIMNMFVDIWSDITGELAKLFGVQGQSFGQVMSNVWEWLKETFMGVLTDFVADVQNIWNTIAEIDWVASIIEFLTQSIEGWAQIFSDLVDTGKALFKPIEDAFKGIFEWFAEVFSIENFKQKLKDWNVPEWLIPDDEEENVVKKDKEEKEKAEKTRIRGQDVITGDMFRMVDGKTARLTFNDDNTKMKLENLNANQLEDLLTESPIKGSPIKFDDESQIEIAKRINEKRKAEALDIFPNEIVKTKNPLATTENSLDQLVKQYKPIDLEEVASTKVLGQRAVLGEVIEKNISLREKRKQENEIKQAQYIANAAQKSGNSLQVNNVNKSNNALIVMDEKTFNAEVSFARMQLQSVFY